MNDREHTIYKPLRYEPRIDFSSQRAVRQLQTDIFILSKIYHSSTWFCKMRFAFLTLFCCALATALPREGEDEGKKWDGGVVKSYSGGVGGGVGVGDVGVGLGGGGGCDPVACDINV